MNIVFANSTRGWGGVNTWALDAARCLHQKGHGINILARDGKFSRRAQDAGLPVTLTHYGMDFHPFQVRRFMRMLRDWSADVVIVNIAKELRTVGVAARLLGLPVVLRLGLPGDLKNSFKVRQLHRWLRPHILVPCEFVKQGLLQNLPFLRPEDITVILTGKIPAESPPAAVADPLRIIAASQLNPEKGHDELLAALAVAKSRGLAFQAEILGTGRAEEQLKERVKELGLEDSVAFLGYQADVAGRLRQADVFVLPSHSEGLPNSLLEAMSQGLIPLSRRVGGVEEVFPESLKPLLFDTGEELAEALASLLQTPAETLIQYKEAAWEQCRQVFDLEGQAGKLETWLESLIP